MRIYLILFSYCVLGCVTVGLLTSRSHVQRVILTCWTRVGAKPLWIGADASFLDNDWLFVPQTSVYKQGRLHEHCTLPTLFLPQINYRMFIYDSVCLRNTEED